MNYRFILAGLLSICAQATLSASTLYDFGPTSGISLADEATAYTAPGTNGAWTEDYYASTGPTIDCVVSLTLAANAPACGSGSAANVPITNPGAGTLPTGCTSNCGYLMVDGSPEYGAPVSVDLSVVAGQSYTLSFYQASTQELRGNTGAYDDSWLVYLLSSSHSTGTFICPQAYCSSYAAVTAAPSGSTLLGQTTTMANPSGGSTAWEQITYTFTAAFTGNQVLEFVANVANSNGTAITDGTTFMPPMLALDDVTLTPNSVPEPTTWGLMVLGGGLILLGRKMRRRFPSRG